MSGATPEDLARRGRLIAFNEYALTKDELAIICFLSTTHEPNGSAASAFTERVWDDLIAVDPLAASQVWQAAKTEQASNARQVVAIATKLTHKENQS